MPPAPALSRRTRLAAKVLASTLAATAGCRTGPPPTPTARHLVLVTIDTLRADRLGAYGNTRVETPRLDRIAREGAVADQATAHVPLTRPSHVSLFTGQIPPRTGIRDNISPAVMPEAPLLAETLKKAGFVTAAFVSSVVLEAASGLDRGFETYVARFDREGPGAQFLSTVQRRGDVTTSEAVAWLETSTKTAPASRAFLWLHLYDPHDPYEPPEPYASRYRDRPYDGEVAFADELVGRLDDALGRLGMRDDSLLLVTSDHGEGLGEHDETLHGFFAYQSTLRIPFLVRGPGVKAGLRLTPTVRLVDVYPTVLELLGLPPPPRATFDGASLAGSLRGALPLVEPVVYAESLVPLLHFGWSDLRVVREGRWKYIQAPRPELYDLATDPGETTNLAAREPARSLALQGALRRFLDEERTHTAQSAGGGTVPPELLEKLGALGYVGGASPAETKTPGADPKDKVQEFRVANDLIRQGLLLFHEKDYGASADRFGAVLRRGISSFEVRFYLARCLLERGRAPLSIPHFAEAARLLPAQPAAWTGLADARAATGDAKGALEALRRGQAVLPKDASLRLAEAHLLTALGRKTEARAAYEAALPLAPRNARMLTSFGELLRELGAVEDAIRRQREAVAIEPASAAAWNSLGMTLGGNGRVTEAEQAFREATRLDPKSHRYAYNLGLILVRQGRGALARPFFEAALALDPAFVPAREQLAALGPATSR